MTKRICFLLFALFIGSEVFGGNLPPVAIITAEPDRSWFYNAEDVVFDRYASYDPEGAPWTGSRWYINDVLQVSNVDEFSKCFVLNGNPGNGCYELAPGQTTVQIKLGMRDQVGAWGYTTVTYTIQTHKGRTYFIKDHLGSVRTTVNGDGNVISYDDYYAFGLVMPGRSNNSANPNDNYKFTSHERDDEAGLTLDYMNARNYDPMIGRFLQIDPLVDQFPGWTPYHYVHNNPLNLVDPTGMSASCPRCDIAGDRRARQLRTGQRTSTQVIAEERVENRANFLGGVTGAIAMFSPALATRVATWAMRNPGPTATAAGTLANAVDPNPGADHLPGTPVDNVGNVIGQAARNMVDDAGSGISRALKASDFGLGDDAFRELSGTFSVSDGIANVDVKMFDGSLGGGKGPLKALRSLIETARSHGASEININASFANEKLMDMLSTHGELINRGGSEVVRIVF
ncbi:MAG: RHS repeat-associated core domain-containing protein [Bacteroidota bacterium]